MRVHVHAVGAVMGGAARHLVPFLGALREAEPRWSVHVWTSAGAAPGLPAGVTATPVTAAGPRARLRWENVDLPRSLRDARADVLLCLTNSGPVRSPVPEVLYQRNALWFDPRWLATLSLGEVAAAGVRRSLTFAQARAASVVVAPSATMAGLLVRWPGWPERTEVRVIPHAVDADHFAFTARPWPPPGRLRMLAVGHPAPYKDQPLQVRILAELVRRGWEAELAVTLDRDDPSGLPAELHALARDAGVTDRVHFLGTVADPRRCYAEADLLLFTSVSESFGFPILEAMACGLPVVPTGIGPALELVGSVPWSFPCGDASSGADAVERLLQADAADVSAVVTAARRRAEALSWRANAAAVAAALRSAAG